MTTKTTEKEVKNMRTITVDEISAWANSGPGNTWADLARGIDLSALFYELTGDPSPPGSVTLSVEAIKALTKADSYKQWRVDASPIQAARDITSGMNNVAWDD